MPRTQVCHGIVSMKSGLKDRNNYLRRGLEDPARPVSMKSGLKDRNNFPCPAATSCTHRAVSMKSGLKDRNNWLASEGGPDKQLYQRLRALRTTVPRNNTLLSCHGVKHLVKPLRALPGGDDTTTGLAAAHTTTGPSSGNLRGTPSIRMSASCGAPRSITTTES